MMARSASSSYTQRGRSMSARLIWTVWEDLCLHSLVDALVHEFLVTRLPRFQWDSSITTRRYYRLLEAISRVISGMNSASGFTPRSPFLAWRTLTLWMAASFSPMTSM